ncbi:quinohemoprotein amine dehydrogenase subunit alpha [Sphingobium sp. AR-3-1]|uniref:Quinohemoprotein amine dehydrogenase subunit alpha n=1 Tax=Sphingobium psychrophilum TaxID=2728834 RepID=A0A7X9ZS06_9SPHN|nr:quinohemoprotein amine dehydrogenase subunit alpha [Sphingobium psychrophilum]NML09056.1 quinohemoprotein amine dehydrogenase subunit alpha [Sphingobium psychrophilum]
MKRLPVTKFGLLALFSASVVFAQADGGPNGATLKETEAGIPVTDPLVAEKCSACHAADAKGNLSRISWVRTTPEGWAQAIKRMVRLNGLAITPQESRAIVKSLSASHGLAPEEARPVMYLPEKRMLDEVLPNETMRGACASCHSFAQPLSWRRSKLEWKTLQDLHVALYSQADAQYRRPAEDSEQPVGHDPKDKLTRGDYALTYMPKVAPLHTPEWAAWRARQRNPRLAGDWLVVASVPGKGRYVGELTVAPGKQTDEFTTSATLRSLTDGGTIGRTGTGIVYAGYSWRGSSTGAAAAKPDDLSSAAREAMWFAPDQQSAQGRWFWGDYQEFGYDVKLVRATAAPAILAVMPGPVKAGTKGVQLRILGHNLPASLSAADVDLGAGVTVTKIVSASPKELVVTADVAPGASSGQRDVAIAGAVLEQAFPVFHKIDYIKATPETALSRLGGIKFPKGYQQFEAIGYENGLDGKPNTSDDIAVGPVEADWAMQEFLSVFYDDDTKYVGALSPTAFFTPAEEGPNPARRFGRNNYGEVWVVATAKTEKDKFGKPLSARSYMVVTVPAYQKWDQPEVSR